MNRGTASLFPRMNVLDAQVDRCGSAVRRKLESTLFVCVQHLLDTTGSLIEGLLRAGAKPEHMVVLGKCYSTNGDVLTRLRALGVAARNSTVPARPGTYRTTMKRDVEQMWERILAESRYGRCDRLVVLDDGGQCLSAIPRLALDQFRVLGVEQTTSGLRHCGACPVILVASSAAKRLIEPRLIAEAVAAKARTLVDADLVPKVCGVIGYGNIGRAVVDALLRAGCRVLVHDHAPEVYGCGLPVGAEWTTTAEAVVEEARWTFGCTGDDIIRDPVSLLGRLKGSKTLISCSSGDDEYRSLLLYLGSHQIGQPVDVLGTLSYGGIGEGPALSVLRGGFPVNFDGSPESVPARDIQMTRGLLFGALIQAVICSRDSLVDGSVREMLHPAVQAFVVDRWMKGREPPLDPDERARFRDQAWIEEQSGGHPLACKSLEETFGE